MKLTGQIVYGFTSAFLLSRFDEPTPIPDFHLELWELMCTDHNKVAVAAPRGHAKSTAVTHSYVLANICFKIKTHILIVSDTEGQASNFLKDIKMEFEENDHLVNEFGFLGFIKDTDTEAILEFENGHQVRIIAKGSEQKLRGIKWRNKRPDLVVGDDLENDEIVMNEERRDKFRRWFYGALLPIGGKRCDFRLVGTVLHMDSLLERLLPPVTDENTVEDGLKQYSRTKRTWLSVRYKAHNEDFTKILWPERFTKEEFMAIRQDYIEQGFPEGYAQEYLNWPIDESTAYFRVSDFKPLDEETPGPEQFYITADLAISTKDSRAYSVFTVQSLCSDDIIRVKDVVRFRGDGLEIIEQFFFLNEAYQPDMFIVEKENIARSLGSILEREMAEKGIYFHIEYLTPSQDKRSRARPLQARMRAGRIQYDMEAEWFPLLQQEFLQFDRGAYMDQVDSTGLLPFFLNKVATPYTQKEYEEILYEEELYETSDYMYQGVSSITGY